MDSLIIPEELLGDIVVSEHRIQSTVKRLAKEIYYSVDYVRTAPIFLCLLKGAFHFHSDLTKELKKPPFEFESAWLEVSSYEKTHSTGKVKFSTYRGPNLKGRFVVIVEDIIDSSHTIVEVCEYLDSCGVLKSNVCTLLFKEKPENIEWRNSGLNGYQNLPEVRHVGLFIKPLFVVGYGLDYRQYGRYDNQIRVLTSEGQDWVDRKVK